MHSRSRADGDDKPAGAKDAAGAELGEQLRGYRWMTNRAAGTVTRITELR